MSCTCKRTILCLLAPTKFGYPKVNLQSISFLQIYQLFLILTLCRGGACFEIHHKCSLCSSSKSKAWPGGVHLNLNPVMLLPPNINSIDSSSNQCFNCKYHKNAQSKTPPIHPPSRRTSINRFATTRSPTLG